MAPRKGFIGSQLCRAANDVLWRNSESAMRSDLEISQHQDDHPPQIVLPSKPFYIFAGSK
jgi:hypothetical protein